MSDRQRFTAIVIIGILVYFLIFAAVSSNAFARGGGEVNLFSHTSTVDIKGDNEGTLVSVAGKGNRVTTPQTTPDKRGQWGGAMFWTGVLLGLIFFILFMTSQHKKKREVAALYEQTAHDINEFTREMI